MTLAERLRDGAVLHLPASVSHGRRGAIAHGFRYRTDYLLLAPEHARAPGLFGLNRFNLLAVHDKDHGGPRGKGRGPVWGHEVLAAAGFAAEAGDVLALLTQPRLLGHWFTPVSFWLVLRGDTLLAAIDEVNNTFGQRHSYLCHAPGFAALGSADTIRAKKVFHVSPFQDVGGEYLFNFALSPARLAIRILHRHGAEGLDAAMAGPLRPLTPGRALAACLRRPGGSLRVLALIYANALGLKLKGARYRPPPAPPEQEIT